MHFQHEIIPTNQRTWSYSCRPSWQHETKPHLELLDFLGWWWALFRKDPCLHSRHASIQGPMPSPSLFSFGLICSPLAHTVQIMPFWGFATFALVRASCQLQPKSAIRPVEGYGSHTSKLWHYCRSLCCMTCWHQIWIRKALQIYSNQTKFLYRYLRMTRYSFLRDAILRQVSIKSSSSA